MGLETRSDGETHRRTPRDWAGAALGRFPAVPLLVLGPLLRYVGEHEATVWVETDVPCEVEVLGRTQKTFRVGTHHYALVCIDGLEAGSEREYGVKLDGEQGWPLANDPFPPPRIRTFDKSEVIRLSFGSCRVATHHHHPYSLKKDDSSF